MTAVEPVTANPLSPMFAVAAVGVVVFVDQFAVAASGAKVVIVGAARFDTAKLTRDENSWLTTCPVAYVAPSADPTFCAGAVPYGNDFS